MSERDFAADRAVCDAALPGPWLRMREGCGGKGFRCVARRNPVLAEKYRGQDVGPAMLEDLVVLDNPCQPGAMEFIAAARGGWPAALERILLLENAIRAHRDSWLSGDDACWSDNETLYRLLPGGYSPPERNTLVELAACEKYIASCHAPHVEYVSPQRRIEELEAENKALRTRLARCASAVGMSDAADACRAVIGIAGEAT